MKFYHSESFLNSNISCDNGNLHQMVCNFLRTDQPFNIKSGGAFPYYRDDLPLNLINIQYLNGCATFEIKLGDKMFNFFSLRRSPNQSKNEFQNFFEKFELTLDLMLTNNPFFALAICDFNAKSNNWYISDTTTFEGSKTEPVTSQFELQQTINEPTHIQGKSVSCVDFIFISQPNLVMNLDIRSFLNQNCHRGIVFVRFNLKFYDPATYECKVWNFKKANTDHITRAINAFS